MYYTSGNYEAFSRPRKPEGVDKKTACFVGSGLAALAGAAFLIRDGQMPGKQITILEQQNLPGGALDGIKEPEKGFVIRGGREMEDHFECLPYVTAFFMPRQAGDRPDVVPEGAVNFAFIGQFAESKERDCIFTTEYSVRTPMEAVYTLLNIERGVPEVFNSTYDIRTLLSATGRLRDGKEINIPGPHFARDLLMKKLDKTQIGALLREFGLVDND